MSGYDPEALFRALHEAGVRYEGSVAVDGAVCGRGIGPLSPVVVLGEPLLEEDQLELIALPRSRRRRAARPDRPHEAEEDVLGTDVVVVKIERLAERVLEDLFARGPARDGATA